MTGENTKHINITNIKDNAEEIEEENRGQPQIRFEEQGNSRESLKEKNTNGKYTTSAMGNPNMSIL